jgi:predicted glutamine amidotransferase
MCKIGLITGNLSDSREEILEIVKHYNSYNSHGVGVFAFNPETGENVLYKSVDKLADLPFSLKGYSAMVFHTRISTNEISLTNTQPLLDYNVVKDSFSRSKLIKDVEFTRLVAHNGVVSERLSQKELRRVDYRDELEAEESLKYNRHFASKYLGFWDSQPRDPLFNHDRKYGYSTNDSELFIVKYDTSLKKTAEKLIGQMNVIMVNREVKDSRVAYKVEMHATEPFYKIVDEKKKTKYIIQTIEDGVINVFNRSVLIRKLDWTDCIFKT